MTTYSAITNGQVDQDSPITQPLMTALRDNPIAITEGASGAPRISSTALDLTYKTGSVSGVTTNSQNIITFDTSDLSNLGDMGLVLVTGNMTYTTANGSGTASIVCTVAGTVAQAGLNGSSFSPAYQSFAVIIPTGGATSITVDLAVQTVSGSTSASATAQLLVLGR